MHPSTSPDPAVHSPAVLELIALQVTDSLKGACPGLHSSPSPLIHPATDYVAETTINAVDTALGYRSSAWNRTPQGKRVPFKRFVSDVIRRALIKMPVLLTTLVYITRAKSHLHIETEDWACERVFLGALMVAAKVCPDIHFPDPSCPDRVLHSTPTTPHYGTSTGLSPPVSLASET